MVPPMVAHALFQVAVALCAGAPGGFSFVAPEGWVDLSQDVELPAGKDVPPALLAQARRPEIHFLAADLAGMADGFAENLNAVVEEGAPTASQPADVQKLADSVGEAIVKQSPQASYKVLEVGLETLHGAPVPHWQSTLVLGGMTIQQAVWVLPGARHSAVLTCSGATEGFERTLQMCREAVMKTAGVRLPQAVGFWERVGASGLRGALVGALAGLGVGALMAFRRRGRG